MSGEMLLTALLECTGSSPCRQAHGHTDNHWWIQVFADLIWDSETKRGDLTMLSPFGTRWRFLATLLYIVCNAVTLSLRRPKMAAHSSRWTQTAVLIQSTWATSVLLEGSWATLAGSHGFVLDAHFTGSFYKHMAAWSKGKSTSNNLAASSWWHALNDHPLYFVH
jgi:hypothetical protein